MIETWDWLTGCYILRAVLLSIDILPPKPNTFQWTKPRRKGSLFECNSSCAVEKSTSFRNPFSQKFVCDRIRSSLPNWPRALQKDDSKAHSLTPSPNFFEADFPLKWTLVTTSPKGDRWQQSDVSCCKATKWHSNPTELTVEKWKDEKKLHPD